jgi:hypothetical protein
MEYDILKQEIDALIAELGEDLTIARPAAEREVIEKIHLLLESTREERTRSTREEWEFYLPYATARCYQISRLEEGWEDELDYFASENAQFWLDNTGSFLEKGDIAGAKNALGRIIDATRMMKRDRIAQVDILLQALEYAFEMNDKKSSIKIYEAAEKQYHKYLAGGSEFTGSTWLPKIKKLGKKINLFRDQLNRYYQYAETVTVTMEAETESDLERIINYLQQNLTSKVTVTRRVKEVNEAGNAASSRFRARIKFTLER